MAGMGPAPKPEGQRRRRNATPAMVQLPAAGRPGRAPRWPLLEDIVIRARRDTWAAKVDGLEYDLQARQDMGLATSSVQRRLDAAREELAILQARLDEQRKLEATRWRELWRTPQAVQWEKLGWQREVAQYVRWAVLGELGDLDAAKEARQWSDRLGLTPLALLRLRWTIVADEVTERRQARAEQTAGTPARARVQDRLRVVDPDAVAGS